jgi:1,4-dihydroxy-2-naphthoate octaprenyltransferase
MGELHIDVAMGTFPLAILHFAMMITFEFPDYLSDLKAEKGTLLIRLGWERGMLIHNIAQLSAYLLLGAATVIGLPAKIVLPAFLPLPLSLLQIWQFQRIAAGSKPNWRALTLNGVVIFSMMAYLLMLTFWTR